MPRLLILVALVVVLARKSSTAFVLPSRAFQQQRQQNAPRRFLHKPQQRRRHSRFRLSMSVDSEDPFIVLNLNPTADKKEIKRAYKRMALKFHPDVVCTSQSTKEDRKKANDTFAKINWAYEQLNGKNASAKNTSKTSTSTGGYTPPHRRKSGAYTSDSKTYSTDWRDYIPNYKEEEEYNTDGDSFSQIFSDLVGAAAGAAVGGGGIFRDFVEFLEDNVDGYTSVGDSDDDDLYTLLRTGSIDEIAMEMDDTELVVSSLETKKQNVADELLMKTADLKFANKFSEKVELEALVSELEARKKVVDGYLSKARKRLLSLQTRYKELVVGGQRDSYSSSRGRRSTYSDPSSSRSSGYKSTSTSSSSYSSGTTSSSSSTTGRRESSTSSSSTASGSNKEEDEWKHQGFGSSGRRGRGSSRRAGRGRSSAGAGKEEQRARQQSSYEQTPPPPPPPRAETPPPRRETSSTRQSQSSSESWKPSVPPHRRTKSEPSQAQKDKKRLRELQVDDEFDKLKKELGL